MHPHTHTHMQAPSSHILQLNPSRSYPAQSPVSTSHTLEELDTQLQGSHIPISPAFTLVRWPLPFLSAVVGKGTSTPAHPTVLLISSLAG